jgi:REP element-mobilizing transposase RayT
LRANAPPDVLSATFKESQRRFFEKYDSLLHKAGTGPCWLKNEEVAAIVGEALQYRNGRVFDLLAFTLMPNQVHVVIHLGQPLCSGKDEPPLHAILQSLKRRTARESNRLLCRTGAFWEEESYDHVIRDSQELESTIRYVLMNPVHAGLVQSWRDWRWSWVKKELKYISE